MTSLRLPPLHPRPGLGKSFWEAGAEGWGPFTFLSRKEERKLAETQLRYEHQERQREQERLAEQQRARVLQAELKSLDSSAASARTWIAMIQEVLVKQAKYLSGERRQQASQTIQVWEQGMLEIRSSAGELRYLAEDPEQQATVAGEISAATAAMKEIQRRAQALVADLEQAAAKERARQIKLEQLRQQERDLARREQAEQAKLASQQAMAFQAAQDQIVAQRRAAAEQERLQVLSERTALEQERARLASLQRRQLLLAQTRSR